MIVYHTSNVIVNQPDIYHSRDALDFGKGFYITILKDQAINYGKKFTDKGEKAWLNEYELSEDWSEWKVKIFEHYDEEWLDYVTACRKMIQKDDFDIVIGGITNDKVFTTINLYFLGLLNKDEALRRLKYEKPNIQYCIRNEEMLQKYIKFIKATEI